MYRAEGELGISNSCTNTDFWGSCIAPICRFSYEKVLYLPQLYTYVFCMIFYAVILSFIVEISTF